MIAFISEIADENPDVKNECKDCGLKASYNVCVYKNQDYRVPSRKILDYNVCEDCLERRLGAGK